MEKIGFYIGSFNPFHYGHLNILQLKFWYIFLPIVILADMEAKARKNDE